MNNFKIINKNALINNYNFCLKSNKQVMCMVKANAYGHGVKQVASVLKSKVKFWGVANSDEAFQLKKILKNNSTILVVGKTNEYFKLIKNNIHITLDCLEEIRKIIDVCKKLNTVAYVHIAINTGMNRIGVKSINQFKQMLGVIYRNTQHIKLCGVFTHCFNADQANTNFYKQMVRFKQFVRYVNDESVLIHIGGSYCLNHIIPEFVNMVRVGYFLYGYGNKNVTQVMHIKSKIIKIIKCKKGENVGYGNYVLDENKELAIIPIGYADGLPRCLSNKQNVLINNLKCKIIGNVCMDCFMVDVTNKNIVVGNNVLVLNNAEYMAKTANTSAYEILTNFSKLRAKVLIE